MNLITLDFETYYDTSFSLSRLTTEEYVRSPEFEMIGVGIKLNNDPAYWVSGSRETIINALRKLPWAESMLLCHNTQFDGAILAWACRIYPHTYLDTLCMARALHGVDVGGSLKALAERYKIGAKGEEVIHAKGKRLADFQPDELARYAEYCINDVELTYKLFSKMAQGFPEQEVKLIDLTLRMFLQPLFYIDTQLLQDRLVELKQEKQNLLAGLKEKLKCEGEEEVRQKLASNPKFAALLKEFGVEPPMKESPRTGKQTFALAKNDEGFIALQEHPDTFVQNLCSVRLGTKSTIEESRIQRFIDVASRNSNRVPIPLKYYGAHTGRWSGSDKINFQNLPSRDKKKKALKNAVVAPEGYVVINSDSSQIEARILAWLAGQDDVVEMFAQGRDVYSEFASKVYGRPISKEDPIERFVGKTCISEGTLVLSDSGWKPIEEVSLKDKLWDGEEWVCHQGLLNNGIKPTLNLCGIWLTPDHQVWSGTQWLEAQSVVADENILYQSLDIGAANLPSQATYKAQNLESKPLLLGATATKPNTQSITTISRILEVLGVRFVQKRPQAPNDTGLIQRHYPMTYIARDYLIDCLLRLPGATPKLANITNTMENGGLAYINSGVMIERRFSNIFKRLMDGICQTTKWIGSTLTETTNREIYDSSHEAKTYGIKERLLTLKPVYDILNCGSRNRFTILTKQGPLIVHNCILGLGYGTGALKLQHTLKTQPPGAVVELDEAKRIVNIYREENHKIPELWSECDRVLHDLMDGPLYGERDKNKKPFYIGTRECVRVDHFHGLRLPSGLYIRYPELQLDTSENKSRMVYKSRKGFVSIWGGSVVENVVQGLARCVVAEQMLMISERYRPALTVHDSVVCVVPEDEADEAMKFIVQCMNTKPEWAKELPITCEAKFGKSYGDC